MVRYENGSRLVERVAGERGLRRVTERDAEKSSAETQLEKSRCPMRNRIPPSDKWTIARIPGLPFSRKFASYVC